MWSQTYFESSIFQMNSSNRENRQEVIFVLRTCEEYCSSQCLPCLSELKKPQILQPSFTWDICITVL